MNTSANTICVAVKVPAGLVLASDSRVLEVGQHRVIYSQSDSAEKIKQIGNYRIGVAYWGLRGFGSRSIDDLLSEFSDTLSAADGAAINVLDIASRLGEFIAPLYEEFLHKSELTSDVKHELGLFIGGYSDASQFPELYSIELTDETIESRPLIPIRSNDRFDFWWGGETVALERLIYGFDEKLLRAFMVADTTEQEIRAQCRPFRIKLNEFSLQDAIDFAVYLVSVVIGIYRFSDIDPLCGGEVDVAVIDESGFKWPLRKGVHSE